MYNQKEEDKARTPFQSWDDILKRIHHKSRCEPRMLSDDLQVDFSVVLHHKHPSKPSPARFSLQVSAINVSTARNISHTIRRFRKMALDTIDYDILDAPFYLICKEEPEDKKFVVAKHGMQVVWEWFERNVRLGDAKFFVMEAQMKCFQGRRKPFDEEMTVRKLGQALMAPVKSKVTGE